MNTNKINKPDERTPDVFDFIAEKMSEFREEMEYYDGIGVKIAAKTRFIMRVVFTVLTISSFYLVFMIYQMSNNMSAMTSHLEDMYTNFGSMSQDMHVITKAVDSMDRSITGMPVIAQSMTQMDGDVRAMRSSVYEINQSISAIDNDMVKINSNMYEMTGRLYNMNRTVNLMTYDVNEMAAPMNSGPMSGFWPR